MEAEQLVEYLKTEGYENLRILPDGTIAGLVRLLFTTGLVLGLTEDRWTYRYCYEDETRAKEALGALKSMEEEPLDGWVAKRPQ